MLHKEKLHLETHVDKDGDTVRKWVKNEPNKKEEKLAKQDVEIKQPDSNVVNESFAGLYNDVSKHAEGLFNEVDSVKSVIMQELKRVGVVHTVDKNGESSFSNTGKKSINFSVSHGDVIWTMYSDMYSPTAIENFNRGVPLYVKILTKDGKSQTCYSFVSRHHAPEKTLIFKDKDNHNVTFSLPDIVKIDFNMSADLAIDLFHQSKDSTSSIDRHMADYIVTKDPSVGESASILESGWVESSNGPEAEAIIAALQAAGIVKESFVFRAQNGGYIGRGRNGIRQLKLNNPKEIIESSIEAIAEVDPDAESLTFNDVCKYVVVRYAVTQSLLKRNGIKQEVLYRGLSGDVSDKITKAVKKKKKVVIEQRTLMSYTDDATKASSFGACVLRHNVPNSLIFMSCKTSAVLWDTLERESLIVSPKSCVVVGADESSDIQSGSVVGLGRWVSHNSNTGRKVK